MEIGLAVGGAFLSSALATLFDRLAPRDELLKMLKRGKHDLQVLEEMEKTLLGLQVVLSDAENKQASNSYVRSWLNKLQDAVDSAENLMEQVDYEVLRLKVEGQHQFLAEPSNQQVSDLNLCFSDEFILDIKDKLEDATKRLKDLENQIARLRLVENYLDSGKQEARKPSTSIVDESDVVGRQSEIKKLVRCLLSDEANGKHLTVIPIVGMAGVGKTTLAKAVYNDEKVKKHFELKPWICVSEAYDSFRITEELLQEIGSFEADNNLNQLQIKLKESLKGKKFLIVLDDVWNENYNDWDELRNLFAQGKNGSKIIVTTRNQSIALMMRSEPIILKTLSTESSWPLFKTHAFENMDPMQHPEHEEIGKKIADKCKGLPLALKTLAGMLRSKSDVEGWRRILKSEIWELPSRPNDMLPALMLSYNDLPSYLKRCFAYLAIFPKDYPFCKEQVIQLWIANGLVQKFQLEEMIENIGNQYFLELRSRSLIDRVPDSTGRNTEKYLMHDLINDLARLASSQLCISLEEKARSHLLERTRHLSYPMTASGDFEKLKPLNKLEQLRTLLPINRVWNGLSKRVLHNILPTLTSLRALSLSGYTIKELPNVLFINLRLLRFLDLSRTKIKKLPDSICGLYNLETLLLSSCWELDELPLQMENLINLRHLDLRGTSRLKILLHPSKLKNLQVFLGAKFLLGGCSGLKIEDLGELHNLYGDLEILELQNVADRREVLKANIRGKGHVEKLSLEWSGGDANSSQNERDILDELQPNRNIKELQITGYRGTKFSNWLADHSFHDLVELRLSNCKDCDSLPALGQLPSLKYLTIGGMARIIEVTEEFYGISSSIKPFKSLKRLEFRGMEEWKQWDVLGNGEFPRLQVLLIDTCPKLTGKLPENLCSLTELSISKCPELLLEAPIQLSNLKKFEVFGSPKVGVLFHHAELFTTQLQGMKQIEELYLKGCESLTSLSISSLPSTMKEIDISNCGKLKLESSVSDMFLDRLSMDGCDSIDEISPELVSRARYLRIERCHSLTRLLIPTGTETLHISECGNLEILSVACETQMTSLRIIECKKLKSLPEGGLLSKLETLAIWDCEKAIDWELPASIRSLAVGNMKTLSSQVLKSLTSLETLCISKLPQIESLLEEGLPTSLSALTLNRHDELHSLPTEARRRLTSLRRLDILSCNQLKSLPESALPSSLSELSIKDCPNLKSHSALPSSLSKLIIWECPNLQSLPELPSSLSTLSIYNCLNLKSLPVKGMPSSITKLFIDECPSLTPSLEFEKGDYWPKIAHIPTIKINGEYL